MVRTAIIDLFIPAHIAELDAICARSAEVGLDGIVVVFDAGDDLPSDGELRELRERFGVAVHAGRTVVSARGFRLLILGLDHVPAEMVAAIEATQQPDLIRAALGELEQELAGSRGGRTGFAVMRVGLRQLPGRTVEPSPAPLTDHDRRGVIAILAEGSLLARDLDLESLGEAGIPCLAASGPFITGLDAIGRFATALPAHPEDHGAIARALLAGHGIPTEMWSPPSSQRPRSGRAPDPFEGREDESDAGRKRKRRRPRRRGGPKAEGSPAAGA
jgi:hypothetical protein